MAQVFPTTHRLGEEKKKVFEVAHDLELRAQFLSLLSLSKKGFYHQNPVWKIIMSFTYGKTET